MDIRIIEGPPREKEQRESLANPNASDDFWFDIPGSTPFAGKFVNETSSLKFSAFYAAVRIRSHAISTLPLILYRRVGNNKKRATDHPLYSILKNGPNPFHTSQEWLELVSVHKDIQGNHYTFIVRDQPGRVKELMPVHPSRVRIVPDKDSGEFFYLVDGDTHGPWAMNEVLHFRDLSLDGVFGISKIKAAKQAISYGLGLEEYGARFINNDASSGVILTHPQSIGDDGVKGLKKSFEDNRRGDNRHRVFVLQEGVKVEKITVPPEDAQFLESRQFSIQEIARFMGVPPHMLSDLSKSSFNNIEQQSLDFLFNTIRPELVKIEQRINKVLLGNSPEFFVEFLVDARARADLASRYKAYSTGLQAGFLTPNEVRGFENLSEVEGGDQLRVPLNTAPIGEQRSSGKEAELVITGKPVTEQAEVSLGYGDHDGTLRSTEANPPESQALPAHVTLRDEFREELREAATRIFDEENPEVRKVIEPLYRRFCEQIAAATAKEADRETPDIEKFTDKIIDSAVIRWGKQSEEWKGQRAAEFAGSESTQVHGAAARASFIAMGFTRIVWRSRGDDCPGSLDGRTIDIDGHFVGKNETLEGDGRHFTSQTTLRHPPLSRNRPCTCYLTAETQKETLCQHQD